MTMMNPMMDPKMKRSIKIEVLNFENEKLVGVLEYLEEDSASGNLNDQKETVWNVAVFCHGLADHKNSFAFPYLSDLVLSSSNQIQATFRFDFSGNGESDGTFSYANYHKEVEDLRSVVTFLNKYKIMNGVKIPKELKVNTVVGHSKAATVVLMYQSKYNDMDYIFYVSGRLNMNVSPSLRFNSRQIKKLEDEGKFLWKVQTINAKYTTTGQNLERLLYVDTKAMKEREELDLCKIYSSFATMKAPSPSHSKILIIHGNQDEIIPVGDAYDLYHYLKNNLNIEKSGYQVHLQIVDANHNYTESSYKQMLGQFILKHLDD